LPQFCPVSSRSAIGASGAGKVGSTQILYEKRNGDAVLWVTNSGQKNTLLKREKKEDFARIVLPWKIFCKTLTDSDEKKKNKKEWGMPLLYSELKRLKDVWDCDSGCFLKCFSLENILK
jgi:hypothetical protein